MAQAVQFAILGLGAGAAYTLLAQGIVLIYRGSGIVNFAHGAIAMFAAYFCFLTLVGDHGWPVGAAIPVAVLFAGLLGIVIQNGILRFMREAAPLVRLVATLGVLIVLQGLAGQKLWDNDFHQIDQFLPTHNYTLHGWFGFDGAMGRVVVQEDRLFLLGIAIVLTFALWAFTRFTRIGLAISASAENERAVSALGWSPNLLASVTWAIGGATAGFAGILLAPNAGLSLTVFTIVVTVSALAVALIGGFSSFPLTLLGGIALGIAETEVLTYSSDISTFLHDTLGIENGATGLQRALPFVVIVVVLVVRGKALPLRSHVLERLPDLGSGVVTRWFLVVVVGGLLLLNGFAFDAKWSTAVYTTLIVGVFILSIVVLTGYAGQLSLAQYAIGGLGALVASRLVGQENWPAELAFLAGVVFAILVGTVFAIPALRTRGVNLAVVTLGLGFAVQQVVFSNQYFTGDFGSVTTVGRVSVFGWDVSAADHPDRYLVVCLGVFVIAALMVANLRRSGSGRRLIAVRNNERAGGIARHQRVRRQALRLQRRSRDRVVRRDPARVQGLDRRLHPLRPVPVDQHRRQRGRRRRGLGAGRGVRRQPRAGRAGLDPTRLDRPRLVADHDRRRHADPDRDPEPQRHRQCRAQRRARHRQAAAPLPTHSATRGPRRHRPQRGGAGDPRHRRPHGAVRRGRRRRRRELPRCAAARSSG